MAQFLTTTEISAQIEQIIKGADSKLVILSPYLKLSTTLFERLQDADRRKVGITMIYGKHELEYDQMKLLTELHNLNLRYYENLHAKCYFNETRMVITSMNMYDFSAQNNREMGVLILKDQDGELFRRAVEEAKSILDSSEKVELGKQVPGPVRQGHTEINYGFCIRCGGKIDLDPERPYCRECYDVWAQYGDPDYEEAFCHICGKPKATTMDRPMCGSCYWISKGARG